MCRRNVFGRAASAAVLLVACLASAPASASVEVGQTFAPEQYCGGTWIQSISPADQYVIPHYGVITSWRHMSSGSPGAVELKVFRRVGPSRFTVVGQSDAQQVAPNALNVFPARVPVQRGDIVGAGLYGTVQCGIGRPSGYGVHTLPGDFGTGTTMDYEGPQGFQIDIAATLESDADCDGRGDETQDGQVDPLGCEAIAPKTTITRHPRRRTARRRATFEFGSSDPAAEFECSLDGQAFSPCASPFTTRVSRGAHTFQVRATDSGGLTDPTPATYRWRVKKRK